MAIGVAKACREAGLRLPQDVSLAGFDDSVIGQYYNPSLTTIHVPMDEMIRNAVGMLLQPDAQTLNSHQGELVCRESVASGKKATSCWRYRERSSGYLSRKVWFFIGATEIFP